MALERKLRDADVSGTTVYTTLEPCTTRTHPKIPRAEKLVERKVARVVIGMLDPNSGIRGRGDQLLSDAGIEVQLFPRELRAQVEDINREFINSSGTRRKNSSNWIRMEQRKRREASARFDWSGRWPIALIQWWPRPPERN